MPIDPKLQTARRARVWLGEDPPTAPLTGPLTDRSFAGRTEFQGAPLSACVEMMIPRGPRSLYGLLGVSFTPVAGDVCRVSIPESGDERPFGVGFEPLGTRSDRYAVGLPSEYVEAVFEGAATLSDAGALPSGVAAVRWAAHGEASSSGPMFRFLTSILLRLTALQRHDLTSPSLLAMFDEPIR